MSSLATVDDTGQINMAELRLMLFCQCQHGASCTHHVVCQPFHVILLQRVLTTYHVQTRVYIRLVYCIIISQDKSFLCTNYFELQGIFVNKFEDCRYALQMKRYSFSDSLQLTIFQDLDSNLLSHFLFNKYEKIQNGLHYSDGSILILK